MKILVKLLGLFLALAGAVPSVRAEVVYNYVGNGMSGFGSIECIDCNVFGSFSVSSALDANLPLGEITPLSYTFTVGNTTITNLNATDIYAFSVGTDASGNIDTWGIALYGPGSLGGEAIIATANYIGSTGFCSGNCILDGIWQYNPGFVGGASVYGSPGIWSIDSQPVPEPASIVLLGAALVGLGLSRRRKSNKIS